MDSIVFTGLFVVFYFFISYLIFTYLKNKIKARKINEKRKNFKVIQGSKGIRN